MTDKITLINWLIGYCIDWLMFYFVDWLADRVTDWLIDRSLDWFFIHWLVDWLIVWFVHSLPDGRIDGWIVACRRRPRGGSDAGRRPTHAALKETMALAPRTCLACLAFLLTYRALHGQSKYTDECGSLFHDLNLSLFSPTASGTFPAKNCSLQRTARARGRTIGATTETARVS
jgi:hypothetical protein